MKKSRFEQPTKTIQSYGVVLFSKELNQILLIQRKDSFGYITCIDNKTIDFKDVAETLATITVEEKNKILSLDWDHLWSDVMKNPSESNANANAPTKRYKDECKARFEWLGIRETVQSLDCKGEKWKSENEWGLPKGRMSTIDNETGQRCALRELKEETGVTNCKLVKKINPIKDFFVGTDGKQYTCLYYVAMIADDPPSFRGSSFPSTSNKEIRKCEWCTIDECRIKLKPSTFNVVENAVTNLLNC